MYILEGKQKTRSSRGFKAAETVGFEPTCRLPDNLISSYLRASFDEIIKGTLSHHSIEQTRINQGFSGINHEFTTPRSKSRI